MLLKSLLAAAVLASATCAASAAPLGCRGHRLGSDNYSLGANAAAPSRAIMNPCSSMYRFGRGHRHLTRRHPGRHFTR